MGHQSMTSLKIFAELNWGKRRPMFRTLVNGHHTEMDIIYQDRPGPHRENIVFSGQFQILPDNRLELIMEDKTDDDLLFVEEQMIDHYIEIKEIEIDGITFENVLFRRCQFQHTMDHSWVEKMKSRGIDILPVYKHSTQLRLNGVWSIEFSDPIWLWLTKEMEKTVR